MKFISLILSVIADDYVSEQGKVINAINSSISSVVVRIVVEREFSDQESRKSKVLNEIITAPFNEITGTICSADGVIAANAFNLRGKIIRLTVQMNGRSYEGKILEIDNELDLALIKIDTTPLRVLKRAPLSEIRHGSFCYVVGHGKVITGGIISSLYRYQDKYFQTDSKMNYGNLGGPVVDRMGRLIGIAAKISDKTPWTQSSGVGFVIKHTELYKFVNKYSKTTPKSYLDISVPNTSRYEDELTKLIQRCMKSYVFFLTGGSGVVISADGYVMTNYHVIAVQADSVPLDFKGVINSVEYKLKLVSADTFSDFALLKIESESTAKFNYLELGDSDSMSIGDFVYAIGNPFLQGYKKGTPVSSFPRKDKEKDNEIRLEPDGNWDPSVSLGQITSMHRYQDWYLDAIQTDAAINPGNSGGPLINLKGEVIGIVGRLGIKYVDVFWRAFAGIGMAISSNHIKRYLPALKKGKTIYHGYIEGITVSDPDPDVYETNWIRGDGVIVVGVTDKTPAHDAGFKEGDLIVQIEKYKIKNKERLHGVVGSYPAGSTVSVTVMRNKNRIQLNVLLGNPRILDKGSKF